jgi:hypothetical protein
MSLLAKRMGRSVVRSAPPACRGGNIDVPASLHASEAHNA